MYEINLKELRDYQKRVKDWRSKKFPMKSFGREKFGKEEKFSKEQNTVIKFIVPLLDILGWKTRSEQVEFEYTVVSVGKKDRKIRADAALYVKANDFTPKILVEVKKIRDPFESGKYLLRYLNKNSKVKYGIFTNGEELKFIDDTTVKDYHPSGLFSIKAEHFHKWPDVLLLLSFGSVKKGVLDDFVKAYHDKFFGWYDEQLEKRKPFDKEMKKGIDYELRLIFAKGKWRELVKTDQG